MSTVRLLARVFVPFWPLSQYYHAPNSGKWFDVPGVRGHVTDQWITLSIEPRVDVYMIDINGVQERLKGGTVTVPGNVGNALLGLGLQDFQNQDPGNAGAIIDLIRFVAYVNPPSPSPADPLTTIGNVGATLIRVNGGAPLHIATPVAVTMTANYTRLANFPLPIGTSPGTILNGTTPFFFKPEADALVAAGAGTYA